MSVTGNNTSQFYTVSVLIVYQQCHEMEHNINKRKLNPQLGKQSPRKRNKLQPGRETINNTIWLTTHGFVTAVLVTVQQRWRGLVAAGRTGLTSTFLPQSDGPKNSSENVTSGSSTLSATQSWSPHFKQIFLASAHRQLQAYSPDNGHS